MKSAWFSKWVMRPLGEWKAGLLECLPVSVRRRLAPPREPYVLEVTESSGVLCRVLEEGRRELGSVSATDQQLDHAMATLLRNREDPFILKLPGSWVLLKNISLPSAAKENLRQVIGFEMDRLTPFTLDQVYFDYQVKEDQDEGEMLAIDVAVVTRKRLESWLDGLRNTGVKPDVISADGLWSAANFLPLEERPAPDIKKVLLQTVPVTAVIILLVIAMTLPLWQKRKVATLMQAREAELRQKAGAVIEIREKLEQEKAGFDRLLASRADYPPAIDVLRLLTNILPDDTWLQQLEIKEKSVVIRGLSSQALSLLKKVEEAPGFANVKFLSSVVQQRGKESFHLSADVVTPLSGDWVESVVLEDVAVESERKESVLPLERKDAVPGEQKKVERAGGSEEHVNEAAGASMQRAGVIRPASGRIVSAGR